MALNQTTLNNLGYVSITVMMGLLLLLWFGIVPQSLALPFLIVAAALFVTRIVLRIKLIRMERQMLELKKNESADS